MSSNAASAGAERAIPVICGPTGAGKSAVAMWLAERHDLLLISADSRQVYRWFDVGTGKPSVAEQRRVAHRGIDIVDPADRYSAAAWAAMARAAIDEARATERQPLIVGGTGFYIKALFSPLFAEPDLDPDARVAVQAGLDECSTDELRQWCTSFDPARAHLGRAQLIRALEVALLTGERLSDLHRSRARQPTHHARYLVVDPGPPLASKIETRAAAMFAAGWVDEVRRLRATVPADAPAWNAAGYRAARQCAAGEQSPADALRQVIVETRQYAKRQRTWFRHQLDAGHVERLVPESSGWEDRVEHWLNAAVDASRVPRAIMSGVKGSVSRAVP